MKEINTIQKREKLNEIYTIGEIGPGGAYHEYGITNKGIDGEFSINIQFQKGPRKERDSQHGVTDQDLLEIVRHRLKSFQAGEYKTECNEKALEYLELALMYLNRRVEDRIERNVLGTYEK